MTANPQNETPPEAESQTRTIAVIQLEGEKQLLRTYQALNDLKKERENVRLILITKEKYAKNLRFLLDDIFEKTFHLDVKHFFKSNLEESTNELNDFIQNLNSENINALINYNSSSTSSYLASLITADHKLGPYSNIKNAVNIDDAWSQFLFSNTIKSSLNPFSQVDLYRNIAGTHNVGNRYKAINKAQFKDIIVSPFSLTERNKWRENKWVETIYKVLRDFPNKKITLIGSSEHKESAKLIIDNPSLSKFKNKINNLVGQTETSEAFKLIDNSCLVIGHNSIYEDLASLCSTPTLSISLGANNPEELTPYQEGSYVLSPKAPCFPCKLSSACNDYACHSDISYQITFACISELLVGNEIDYKNLQSENSAFHMNSSLLHKSLFTKSKQQVLDNIAPEQELDLRALYLTYYRVAWNFILNENHEPSPIPKVSQSTTKTLEVHIENLEQLYELNEFGKRYSKNIIEEVAKDSPDISVLKEFSAKIDEIDELCAILVKANPYLAGIVEYYAFKKANLKGANIVQLAESSFITYQQASDMCKVFFELISTTLEKNMKLDSTLRRNSQSL